ncbi:MAG: dTDP-4-amino-4,6-dideoxygalactose transaminase [Bdellovibrionaceae bacterium]|nr:dTDP-4-amino-4,6-dideoxygalactose transaminase [Bdellovibrionales bacterium]MCB9254414.1 dTDP-4-amino-4,6-dideoxygalactose transaminase [Pseudobdellovibrionaceae bacterium]
MIRFSKPFIPESAYKYTQEVLQSGLLSGDFKFTKLCHTWLQEQIGGKKALLTTSCTHALEMAAILCGVQPGDEVIMPSFTFSSTANAFVLRGATPVFIDVRADTMNMDEKLIEAAITSRTKGIAVVHYAGVGCEMDTITAVALKHGLWIVEDAAQGILASYKSKPLGSFGVFGALSFHETKNFTSGEGGALILNTTEFIERAEVLREKGTNRTKYFRGDVDKYSWTDVGSSYLPSDINAAILYSQLEIAEEMQARRFRAWDFYWEALKQLEAAGWISLPQIPKECSHNAHIFYLKTSDLRERSLLIDHLKSHGISSAFHYVPLHGTLAGKKYGRFAGNDVYTTRESERLLRLPLYAGIEVPELQLVVDSVLGFYKS